MTWVRIDDNITDHPKIVAVGSDAAWLFIAGLCYCSKHLTDGQIPKPAVARLIDHRKPLDLANRLVEAGLWDACGDGFVVHDYLAYQPSRTSVESDRAAAKQRMRRARQAKNPETPHRTSADVRPNGDRTSGEVRVTGVRVTPSHPIPSIPPPPPEHGTPEPPDKAGDGAPAGGGNKIWDLLAQHEARQQDPGTIRDPARWIAAKATSLATQHSAQSAALAAEHPTWDIHDIAQALDPTYPHPTGKSIHTRNLEANTARITAELETKEANLATPDQTRAGAAAARAALTANRQDRAS